MTHAAVYGLDYLVDSTSFLPQPIVAAFLEGCFDTTFGEKTSPRATTSEVFLLSATAWVQMALMVFFTVKSKLRTMVSLLLILGVSV